MESSQLFLQNSISWIIYCNEFQQKSVVPHVHLHLEFCDDTDNSISEIKYYNTALEKLGALWKDDKCYSITNGNEIAKEDIGCWSHFKRNIKVANFILRERDQHELYRIHRGSFHPNRHFPTYQFHPNWSNYIIIQRTACSLHLHCLHSFHPNWQFPTYQFHPNWSNCIIIQRTACSLHLHCRHSFHPNWHFPT